MTASDWSRAVASSSDRNLFARQLFAGLPDRYDALAELLSFGQNRRWRRAMIERIVPATPGPILDVATGTAGVAIEIARRNPASVIGVDLTIEMLRRGRRNVTGTGLDGRVVLVAARAEQLPFRDRAFEGLTFTYLLRYVEDPAATLREIARVLADGSPVASLDFFVPPRRFWRAWWWLYTRLVLPAAGALTGGREWYRVGRFLGPSISGHYRRHPLSWIVAAWQEAGLADVGVRVMSLGGGLVMWGRKRGRG